MAKLLLIGRLGKDPEVRYTKTEKEYVSYVKLRCCVVKVHILTFVCLQLQHRNNKQRAGT